MLEENHAVQIANGADNVLLDGRGARRALSLAGGGRHRRRAASACRAKAGSTPTCWPRCSARRPWRKGVELIQGEVTGVAREANRITGVTLASGETISCGTLVNAAGTGAGALAGTGGHRRCRWARASAMSMCSIARRPPRRCTRRRSPSCRAASISAPRAATSSAACRPRSMRSPTDLDWEVDHAWFEERIWPALAERVPLFEAIKVISAWMGHYDYNALDQNAVIGPHPEVDELPLRQRLLGPRPAAGPGRGQCHRRTRHPWRLPHHRSHPLRL